MPDSATVPGLPTASLSITRVAELTPSPISVRDTAGMRRALVVVVVLAIAGCGGGSERAPTAGDGAGPVAAPPGPIAVPDAAPGPAKEADPPARATTPATQADPAATRGGGVATEPDAPADGSRWAIARLVGRTSLRGAPAGRAVGAIGRSTQFGSPRVLSVIGRRGAWLKVVVPERPNARPGWIPAARARMDGTDVSLVVDRSARTLAVREGDRIVQRLTVGVGAPGHPTPTGRFAVTDKLRMGGPGTTYGCCAIALSAHQPHLPAAWNGLDRIAVHGTQSPETIGVAGSLGCMHAGERDLQRLMRIVPLGAPVFIRA